MIVQTSTRPANLPEFTHPPLNELVLSIQFGGLPFKNVHAGMLWQRFAKEYPNVEEQGPIEPTFETFGPLQAAPGAGFQLLQAPEALRYWFVSGDGNELLQVQRDRLIHNWRRRKDEDQYPRYEIMREKFKSEVAITAEFFRSVSIGEIQCNQCEVTYTNIILVDGVADPTSQLECVFTIVSNPSNFLGPIERGNFSFSFVLAGRPGDEPFGRLYVSASPVLRPGGKSAIRLNVSARGKPKSETVDSAFEWLDEGRRAAVEGFAAVTTDEMHRQWGRVTR